MNTGLPPHSCAEPDFLIMSGQTLYTKWADSLADRIKERLLSVRALHLSPESDAFSVVQQTWRGTGLMAAEAERERIRSAKKSLEELFDLGFKSLVDRLKEEISDGTAFGAAIDKGEISGILAEIQRENDRRKDEGTELLPYPKWDALFHDKCPFYSMYLFDDKAYVAMYPFIEPGEEASPVYAYPRSSKEYERLDKEFEMMWRYAQKYTAAYLAKHEQQLPG